jgi:hypothetical protein
MGVLHIPTEEQVIHRILWEVKARVFIKGKFHCTESNIALCYS